MLQPLNSCEGYFSLPLACKLLPSTVGRAQQLLAKGRALDALYCLCPGSTSVLLAYAGEKKQARWRYPADLCCAVLSICKKAAAQMPYCRHRSACSENSRPLPQPASLILCRTVCLCVCANGLVLQPSHATRASCSSCCSTTQQRTAAKCLCSLTIGSKAAKATPFCAATSPAAMQHWLAETCRRCSSCCCGVGTSQKAGAARCCYGVHRARATQSACS